jgi:hypothetical protein
MGSSLGRQRQEAERNLLGGEERNFNKDGRPDAAQAGGEATFKTEN